MADKIFKPDFISTYATVLFALRGKQISNLSKSSIAVAAIAATLEGLNAIKNKSKELADQQKFLVAVLTELSSSANNQPQDSPTTPHGAEIGSNLTYLKSKMSELNQLDITLRPNLKKIDEIGEENDKLRLQHQEEYFTKLETILSNNNTPLTKIEKEELRRCISTSYLEEKRKELEKLGIKIPDKDTYFSIAAHDAVVSILSRSVKKNDNESVKEEIKKLSIQPLIKEEITASKKIKEQYEKQFKEVIEIATNSKRKVEEINPLTAEQIEPFERLLEQPKPTPKPTADQS